MAHISTNVPWLVNTIIDKANDGKIKGNVTIIQMPLPDNDSAAVWLIDSDKTRRNLERALNIHSHARIVHL